MKPKKITTEEILHKEVADNIKNFKKLVLAFSGGLDSTVLLDILCNIKCYIKYKQNNIINQLFTLRAIHIHHGLNHNADYWAKHCLQECERRNVQLNLVYIDCSKHKNHGIEATARQIRYKYLFNSLNQSEILLTAQHLDDQAETFLLALKRGSGPTGLSSMPKKKLYKNQLLRPLLQCTKEQITTYAYNKQLNWIIDDSNINTRFDRNFLRLNILPILKKRWPKINYTIARSAQLCANQEKLLNELLRNELKKLYYYDHSLLLQPLMNMSIEKRQILLRHWLSDFNIRMPSLKKLHHIWKNVIMSKKDATPIIQLNKNFLLRRFQYRLYITSAITQTSLNNTIIIWNNINKKLLLPHYIGTLISVKFANIKNILLKEKKLYSKITILPNTNYLYNSYTHISKNVLGLSLIRAPYKTEIISIKFEYSHHEKIYMIEQIYSKKLKKIWKEFKIPPWIRKKIPLLFYNNKLITAIGIFITQDGNIKTQDNALKIYWTQEEKNINPIKISPTNINYLSKI